jgi:predicted nucleic acid-binding protein
MSDLVLIDTNAWITFFDPDFRGLPIIAGEVEKLIETGRASYTEIIYMELFVGVQNEDDVRRFKSAFTSIPLSSLVERSVWFDAHENAYKLWKARIKPRLVDVIIATVAMHYDMQLFHHDEHFVKMKKVFGDDFKEYNFLKR